MTILITGAAGFIGNALAHHLSKRNDTPLKLTTRTPHPFKIPNCQTYVLGDLNITTAWQEALDGVSCIIHTAGIAHSSNSKPSDYAQTNLEATRRLALSAAAAGVKHFIFLSSVGVHGRISEEKILTESSPYAPYNSYSKSKLDAEEALQRICLHAEMALTIIRPPLVYAAHAPGNFQRLLSLVYKGIPLPLGEVKNIRAMIALENLIDFIATCIENKKSKNESFLIADKQHFSTAEIITILARGMNKQARLFSLSPRLLHRLSRLTRQEEKYQQLCGNLQLDTKKARTLLTWHEPITATSALEKAAGLFIAN